MAVPNPVRLRLRADPVGQTAWAPAAGQGRRIWCDVTDDRGRTLDSPDLKLRALRPGANRAIRYVPIRQALGLYYVDLPLDASGTWRFVVDCLTPRQARGELSLAVTGTSILPTNPPPDVLVLDSDDLLVYEAGGAIDARRTSQLPTAATPAGRRMHVIGPDGTDEQVSYETLSGGVTADAADAGREAGSGAGRAAAVEEMAPAVETVTRLTADAAGSEKRSGESAAQALQAATAAQAALGLSGSYLTQAAMYAATGWTLGKSVQVTNDPDAARNGIYVLTSTAPVIWTYTSSYTISAMGNAVAPLAQKLADSVLVPAFTFKGRPFQAHILDPFTRQVSFGQYLDDGSFYIRGLIDYAPQIAAVAGTVTPLSQKLADSLLAPPITFGGRSLQPYIVDPWNRQVSFGQYLDDGSFYIRGLKDWSASIASISGSVADLRATYGSLVSCPAITFQGRPFQPLELDPWTRTVIAGTFTDTGERWPKSASAPPPRVVLEVVSATEFRAHLRGDNPNSGTYVSLVFRNVPDATRNSDVWRCWGGYESVRSATTGAVTLGQMFSGNGEWEFAVQLSGNDQFTGGNAHGNEERTSFYLTLNGKMVDLSVAGRFEGSDIQIFQQSKGYPPNSTAAKAANAGWTDWSPRNAQLFDIVKRWSLDSQAGPRMVLTVRLKWLQQAAPVLTYLGMFKSDAAYAAAANGYLFTRGARGYDWVDRDVADASLATVDVNPEIQLRSPVGIAVAAGPSRGWDEAGRNMRWNYSSALQKVYADWYGSATVPAGTIKNAEFTWRFYSAN